MESRTENVLEYLSKDILEENFVEIFSSLYRLQYLLGSSRVVTKNRFVTSSTLLQKCYTILCFAFTFGSNFAALSVFLKIPADKSVKALGLAILFSSMFGYYCNVTHVRFFNGRQNAEFHVQLQKLDRLMKIETHKTINSDLKRHNTITVCLILLVFVLVIATCVVQSIDSLAFIGLSISVFTMILEMVACSSIVVYFFVRVRFINLLVESYLNQEENVRKPIKIVTSASSKWIQVLNHDTKNHFATSDVHIYLRELFLCFAKFQDLYRFQLLLFCLKLTVFSIMSFEMVIVSLRNNFYGPSQLLALVMFMIVDSFIAGFLGHRFEMFYSEVKETKRLSISVMALHQEGPLWEKARSMLKIIEEAPPQFSVYDMWEMNAGTFVTMFSLVTNMILTLIQFAFV